MARRSKNKAGKLSMSDMRSLINKKAGMSVAHDLTNNNPTEVKDWIPTGSRWLDSIICRGKLTGIPVGKVVEIAGLEATGKSYMAAQVAANAQKMGMDVIYFDSESAIDPTFLERTGCDLENLLYIQAQSVEFVLETIEDLLANNENRMLFIWDSLALTPSVSDVEGDFNPLSSMAVKARILAKGMSKLTVPIANSQSTFLVLNQLKTNITRSPSEAMVEPYMTPGGKAMIYSYSLRIWLTGRKSKASYVLDERGFRVGSEVKATLKKSRFGTQGRQASFKILWGEQIGVQDEESWFEAIKASEHLKQSGAWYTLLYKDGSEDKFQPSKWKNMLTNEKFRDRVLDIMDEEVILKFDKRQGEAADFYDIENEDNQEGTQLSVVGQEDGSAE
jgi:recombination protein RecA